MLVRGKIAGKTGHPRRKGSSMRLRTSATDARHEDILELEPLLRRVVGARVRDPDTVDDLVQEALARVIAVRGRLDDEAVAPYAIVTARNLVTSLAREEERGRRHRPRLVDPSEPERPEDAALRNEEAAAVDAALAGLPDHEREVVVAHEVHGVDTATLAEARSSTPGAVGVQLARTRARLRLDYLLALRRVELPTARCRPVLLALSAGDRRRQLALDAGGHLMQCPTCASLSRPLVERRRSIAVLLPLLALWWLWRRIQAWVRRRPVMASVTAVSAVAVTGLVLVPPLVERDQAPRPAPTTTTLPPAAAPGGGGGGTGVRLVVPGRSLLPVPGREVLARHAGQRVRGVHVPARGIYADEGFWAGTGSDDQLWVRLVGRGESPFRVRTGLRATFTGRLVPNPPGFAEQVGMVPAEGAALVERQGYHIEVAYDDLDLEP
jgi:RNA polymerase sigma factor (sigma-70 family)